MLTDNQSECCLPICLRPAKPIINIPCRVFLLDAAFAGSNCYLGFYGAYCLGIKLFFMTVMSEVCVHFYCHFCKNSNQGLADRQAMQTWDELSCLPTLFTFPCPAVWCSVFTLLPCCLSTLCVAGLELLWAAAEYSHWKLHDWQHQRLCPGKK